MPIVEPAMRELYTITLHNPRTGRDCVICAAPGTRPGNLRVSVNGEHQAALATQTELMAWLRRKLPRTKNGDARDVPLSKRAREILAALPRDRPTCFDVHAGTRDALWRRAVKAARIDNLHFHDSRAEAIYRLSTKFNIMELARIIGHRDPRSLMLYYNTPADVLADRL